MKIVRPVYELTVGSAIAAIIEKMEGGKPVYEKLSGAEGAFIRKMDVVKKIGVSPEVNTNKINASGIVYDVTTSVKGATAELGVIALPREFLDKAMGARAEGALSIDVSRPQGKEFSFGYVCEMSDGSQVYYWHPRCKLVQGAMEHEDDGGNEVDPETSYNVEILPTDEGVWRVRYYTGDVAPEKNPLTLDMFYGALAYSMEDILGLPAKETNKGG